MVNFVIYEDEKKYRERYVSVIIKMMGERNENYAIIEIDEYNSKVRKTMNLVGKKVYILDIEVPGKSGLDLAREIRNNGDWESQIIIVTNHDNLQQATFTSRLLTLDFISKLNNLGSNLKRALLASYSILTSYKSLKTRKEGEVNQFFYDDINYIKKEADDLDVKIYFKDGSYKEVNETINKLEEMIDGDPRFFRTHRGCIVNITKIKSVDFNTGIITFQKGETNLLARDKKKSFKEVLCDNQIIMDVDADSATNQFEQII